MTSALAKRTVFSWEVEPTNSALKNTTETNGRTFAATSTSAATTSVTASGRLTATNNYNYVGRLLKCTGPETSANFGFITEITQFTASTYVLVCDPFPAIPAANDFFEMYDVPDPIFVNDNALAFRDAVNRTEATGYWTGDYIVMKNQDSYPSMVGQSWPIGTSLLIASSALGGFWKYAGQDPNPPDAKSVAGALCHLRCFPTLEAAPDFKGTIGEITRDMQRGSFSKTANIEGPRSWTCGLTLALKGSGTGAGLNVVPTYSDTKRPMLAICSASLMTGTASNASSTTTLLKLNTLLSKSVGQMILDGYGRTAMIVSSSWTATDVTYTVSPPLDVAPAAGDVIYGSINYSPIVTGHKTMTLELQKDQTRITAYGGLPKITISDWKKGAFPKMNFNYEGGFFYEVPVARPAGLKPTFSTEVPKGVHNNFAILYVSDTGTSVKLNIIDANIDLGIQTQKVESCTLPNGDFEMRLVDMAPVISLTAKLDTASGQSWDNMARFISKTKFSLLMQHEKRPGKTVAFYAHRCQFSEPTSGLDGALETLSFKVRVLDSEQPGTIASQNSGGATPAQPDWTYSEF